MEEWTTPNQALRLPKEKVSREARKERQEGVFGSDKQCDSGPVTEDHRDSSP